VMAKRKALRQRPDCGFLPIGHAPDRQQQKVLLRLKSRLQRRRVAFLQKPPYTVA